MLVIVKCWFFLVGLVLIILVGREYNEAETKQWTGAKRERTASAEICQVFKREKWPGCRIQSRETAVGMWEGETQAQIGRSTTKQNCWSQKGQLNFQKYYLSFLITRVDPSLKPWKDHKWFLETIRNTINGSIEEGPKFLVRSCYGF